jgi:hypothetical protein
MSPLRFHDDEPSNSTAIWAGLAGALAGFAIGMLVSDRVGGLKGLRSRLRSLAPHQAQSRMREAEGLQYDEALQYDEDLGDFADDELEAEGYDAGLEERVLEAFRNDPTLAERAVDIGSVGEGVIELAGWVGDEKEAQHAVTIARGVPGVNTVINRIALEDDEERLADGARRFRTGDPASHGPQWEGEHVGTGRRRQGTSADLDRHSDPKVPLEEHWLAQDAVRQTADDTEAIAERRRSTKQAVRRDRAGGAPVSPSGVPKADHVVPQSPDQG